MATNMRVVYLPAGKRPGWELDDEEMNAEGEEWNSVADSLVILQSLKQSREKWLTSAFPKFSGRARGSKHPELKPPAHSVVKSHNEFELSIGPHIFSNTRLYEVRYLPEHPQAIPAPSSLTSTPATGSFAPGATMASSSSSTDGQTHFSNFVTPALLEQVTQAAATDPILHNLLTLAQRNQLTEEQRSTLATFVRSLNERLGSESSVGLSTSATPSPPPRPFDLVIEFHERSSDRWLVPRGAVYLEDTYESTGGSQYDVIVTINLPLSQSAPASHEDDPMSETKQTTVPTQAVKLQWKGLHQDSYDLLMTWAEGKPGRPDNVSNTAKRTYLAHQLPDGELIDVLRAACTPYLMKSIKPSNADSTRTRRKSSTRKLTTERIVPTPVSGTGGVTSVLSFSTPAPPLPVPHIQTQPSPVPPSTFIPVTVTNPAPSTSAPAYTQSVFPILPPQPIQWNPPLTHVPRPTEYYPPGPPQYAPPQYGAPPPIQYAPPQQYQYSSVSPHPGPTYPAPPAQHSQSFPMQPYSGPPMSAQPPPGAPISGNYNGNGVSFAPISTPAIEAKTVESSIKRATAKRTSSTGSSVPPPIRCRACKETDIPLLMGGRICRKCLDGGRIVEAIPEFANGSAPSRNKSPSGSASPTSTN